MPINWIESINMKLNDWAVEPEGEASLFQTFTVPNVKYCFQFLQISPLPISFPAVVEEINIVHRQFFFSDCTLSFKIRTKKFFLSLKSFWWPLWRQKLFWFANTKEYRNGFALNFCRNLFKIDSNSPLNRYFNLKFKHLFSWI